MPLARLSPAAQHYINYNNLEEINSPSDSTPKEPVISSCIRQYSRPNFTSYKDTPEILRWVIYRIVNFFKSASRTLLNRSPEKGSDWDIAQHKLAMRIGANVVRINKQNGVVDALYSKTSAQNPYPVYEMMKEVASRVDFVSLTLLCGALRMNREPVLTASLKEQIESVGGARKVFEEDIVSSCKEIAGIK